MTCNHFGGYLVAAIVGCSVSPFVASGQTESPRNAFDKESAATSRWNSLPPNQGVHFEGGNPSEYVFASELPAANAENDGPPLDLKSLLRPQLDIFSEWQPAADGLAMGSHDLSIRMPVYPVFGPPPPLITGGYSFTQIAAPAVLDLPASLHEFSFGLAWMRPINEEWMGRVMTSGAFASDLDNTGSDAWQVRAGGFVIYRPNQQWSFAFGALATGRDDLPVLPAAGAIWESTRGLRVNLMMPNPRIALLLAETQKRQYWGYLGGGISGGTWAYDRASGLGDRLSYREWRLVLGWESKHPQPPGTFRPSGTRINSEIGCVLGRKFEFDSMSPAISADDTLLFRMGIGF